MPYGEILTLAPDGLMIEPHLVQSIGIYHESRCWGKEVRNVINRRNDLEPHFIISTIPYEHWPTIIRIDIRVLNTSEAYLKALEIIKNNDVNIISLRTTHGGITHNDIQIIGEISYLQHDESVLKEKEYALKNNEDVKFRPNLTMLIFGKIYDIEKETEENNKNNQFLYDTKNSDGGVLFDNNVIKHAEIKFKQKNN